MLIPATPMKGSLSISSQEIGLTLKGRSVSYAVYQENLQAVINGPPLINKNEYLALMTIMNPLSRPAIWLSNGACFPSNK